MKQIPLTQGKFTIVDDDDFEKVKQFKWNYHHQKPDHDYKYGRAARRCKCPIAKGVYPTIFLHRQIMSCPKGFCIDHINHNTLDNRKSNLRICTTSQNAMNSRKCRTKKTSEYKGVSYDRFTNKWMMMIELDGKRYRKRFCDEIDAALHYDTKARELFAEFAHPNFPTNIQKR